MIHYECKLTYNEIPGIHILGIRFTVPYSFSYNRQRF